MTTGNAIEAADRAGYSGKVAAQRLLNTPIVKKEVAARRESVSKKIEYTAETAMEELKEAMQFAKDTRNATAMVKAIETRAKVMGLLIEKNDVRLLGQFSINISGIDTPINMSQIAQAVVSQLPPPAAEADDDYDEDDQPPSDEDAE